MTKQPRRSSSVPPSRGSVTENQNETIAFLSDADSYGLRANVQVERCATHASVVFLAGDFAYKLKRAVRYPYLDYSTVERRRAMCEAELSINRRLAPSLYLEVRPVARDTNARLHFGSSDESAVDWVLVMRRFAQADLLENVRRVRKLDRQTIRVLGDSVAAFHGRAERKPEFGGAPGIERVLQENAEILKSSS